ncbi:FGGY-family carbohydrate kinase [Streptomyces sp. NPDC006333]|uniref:FGGY-family carbohydrate kinase n=1 Tax=Streptomyces sp. NPDC006333 TaxID=3156753 RepID=UPI0033BF1131
MSALLLGIDIGTSSSKAVLARPDGTVVAQARVPHAVSMPRPGWAEHDAEQVWWADVVALCRQLLPTADGTVAAVSVSGLGPCLLPVDADGRPLRPAILYGIDTRATREIDELTERYGAEELLRRGGSVLTSQAIGPKLAWLRRHEPDVYARTDRFLMASSYVVERLTGAYVLDHHSASQCDPLYDLHAAAWIPEIAADIAPGIRLPSLLWPGEIAGRVDAHAAKVTGVPVGTPVTAGTVDAWAEALSAGVEKTGDCMLMYGTTMFLVEILDQPLTDARLWATRGIDPGSCSLAGGTATSGAVTDWLRELTGARFEDLTAEAEQVAAGSHGLVMLPYFAGERTPLFDPDARGAILGLTLRHNRAHLYRASLEATAYAVRHHLEVMDELGARPTRLIAVGGGTTADLWTQIVSDVTGRTQELPDQRIGASYGDALLAARAVDLADRTTSWATIGRSVEPRAGTRDVYEDLYTVYRDLYRATREQAHALAEQQRLADLAHPVAHPTSTSAV